MKSHLFHWTIPLLIFSCSPNAIADSLSTDQITTDTTTDTTQTGVIQFNNTGLSALAYPNCGGTCVFAIGRLVPGSRGTTAEAVAGIVWQLRSPENTRTEAQRLLLNAQSENLTQESTLILTEKLADALEQRKPNDLTIESPRITLLAILLAKRLGYADHHQLLQQLDRK